MFYRFAHLSNTKLKVGDSVKNGDLIGLMGSSGNSTSVHLHLDIFKTKPKSYTEYVFGMTKNQVEKIYKNPTKLIKTVLPNFSHYGWKFLEKATYGSKTAYHPGVDLNSGAGNSDLGHKIYSPVDGKVVYSYSSEGYNGGWGRMIVVEEVENAIKPMQASVSPVVTSEEDSILPVSLSKKNALKVGLLTSFLSLPVVKSQLRSLFKVLGGIFGGIGIATNENVDLFVGCILIIYGLFLSWEEHNKKGK